MRSGLERSHVEPVVALMFVPVFRLRQAMRVPGLVTWPDAGRGQLHRPPVGVPKVQALPSARPPDATLDRNTECGQFGFPRRPLISIDREGEVRRAAAIVRRHEAVGRLKRL